MPALSRACSPRVRLPSATLARSLGLVLLAGVALFIPASC